MIYKFTKTSKLNINHVLINTQTPYIINNLSTSPIKVYHNKHISDYKQEMKLKKY